MLTCGGYVREVNDIDNGGGYDFELLSWLDDEFADNDSADPRDPLQDWLAQDGLTLIDKPHIVNDSIGQWIN
jgi:hypothetical protein